MYCNQCGTRLTDGSVFCISCGARLDEQKATAAESVGNNEAVVEETTIREEETTLRETVEPAVEKPIESGSYSSAGYEAAPTPAPARAESNGGTYQSGPAGQQAATYQNNYYQAPAEDPNDKPMKVGDWIITWLILIIPLVNLVMPFVWAFGSNVNKSKKSYFQAYLIMMAIGIVLWIIFAAAIGTFFYSISDSVFY